ncbi:TetR/AcrR family transcriptional regulator [Corynebacterium pygosceleis]|uniref:TetR/AcrR family transcriptional regulator n=1 Tax=Corynebacterium pygosceleis TaxID=2800406 RepID=A0A9Q4C921_9CORY|nr:TetR/AcrR family transcriptional regulator [Corynebacterium pygosceleis]MCK7638106.1 TetR/AcrR family transcriptional regulator [Corynebacterium pygosceleis]MCK7675820.1 TetR/AcrR family transcriptional regulator [Corynebacterium pygosceleis]MCL0120798.1 TetR/AcrR family transcriptional regulator [Corynebacterium pygosceleis]MCX7444339.1 TetR/AcrR family transcriptional regulator [Corynebacterium pygosceleis]MCX7468822.1 TetR/AcrR family transcriptional regulator [Corynebacterium pygoscelei
MDAAISQGIDRFTLTGVAKTLGVAAPSLYRVVNSRDDLLMHCFLRVTGELNLPDPEATWQDQLREYTDALWNLCGTYPGIAHSLLTFPGSHFAIQDYLDDLTRGLTRASFPGGDDDMHFIVDMLSDNVLVASMVTQSLRDGDGFELARQRLGSVRSEERQHFPIRENLWDHDWLQRKTEFVIRGMELQLRP